MNIFWIVGGFVFAIAVVASIRWRRRRARRERLDVPLHWREGRGCGGGSRGDGPPPVD